jgi:integrase
MKLAPKPISDDLVKRVILSLSLPGYEDIRDAVFLAAFAGLRPAEIVSVQWSDVNDRDHTLTVRNSKNMSARGIPMHEELAKALRLRSERLQKHEGPVFGGASRNTIARFHNGFRPFRTSSGRFITWSALRRWYAAGLASASSTHTPETEHNG